MDGAAEEMRVCAGVYCPHYETCVPDPASQEKIVWLTKHTVLLNKWYPYRPDRTKAGNGGM